MSEKPHFDAEYFERQYQGRPWRRAGDKPVLNASRLRLLRHWMPEGTILEIGTGLGAFALRMAPHYRVVGMDLDPVVVARSFAGSAVLGVSGSAYELPVRDGSMDGLVIFDVLEHLSETDRALAEIRRVLRPGGVILMSVPNPEGLGARRKGAESFIHRDSTHCSVLSMEEWKRRFAAAGIEEAWSGTDGLWDPPYISWLPARLQWLAFTGLTQAAWSVARPAFPWRLGENSYFLGRRPE